MQRFAPMVAIDVATQAEALALVHGIDPGPDR